MVNGQVSFHFPSGTSLPKKTLYASSHHLLNWEPKWIRFEVGTIRSKKQWTRAGLGQFWAESRVPSVRVRVQVWVIDIRVRVQVLKIRTRVLHHCMIQARENQGCEISDLKRKSFFFSFLKFTISPFKKKNLLKKVLKKKILFFLFFYFFYFIFCCWSLQVRNYQIKTLVMAYTYNFFY